MAVSLREYRARIKSTESMKKITRAMELIAASRIIKAQQRAQAAAPYARELTRAVSALATYSNVDHPMTTEPEDPKRAAVLIVTSDRGLAGAYSSNVLKEAERLAERLRARGQGGRHLHRRPQGRGLLQVPRPPGRRVVVRASPTSRSTTTPATIGEALIDGVHRRGGRGRQRRRGAPRLHPVPVDAGPGPAQRAAAAAGGRRGRGAARVRRGAAALRVRAVGRGGARRSCCRSTSRAGSSSRCCRRRPPSSPPARRR